MTPQERIRATAIREPTDKVPSLGGWITSAEHYQALSGTTPDEFWADPESAAIAAYQALGVDGLIDMFIPPTQDRFRHMSTDDLDRRMAKAPTIEHVRDYVDREVPSPDAVERDFDAAAVYQGYVEDRLQKQEMAGDIVWLPPFWEAPGNFMWYAEFGYESYLGAVAEYPDSIRKLWESSATKSRLTNAQIAKAIVDNDFPKVLLVGQDICTTAGPMVSPAFLEKHYFPNAAEALRPLHEAGIKTLWHSDGNILPILDSILDLGVAGFQGFQEEIGVSIGDIAQRRTSSGDELIFFGSMSVSGVLPHGTVDDVKRQVEFCKDATGGRGLFICPANTIGPEVPLENIVAMYLVR